MQINIKKGKIYKKSRFYIKNIIKYKNHHE